MATLILIFWFEIILTYTTNWAYPVVRDIFKSCFWLNATVWITYCGVVDISANFTNVLHNHFCFSC